jgi:hypothetical protein
MCFWLVVFVYRPADWQAGMVIAGRDGSVGVCRNIVRFYGFGGRERQRLVSRFDASVEGREKQLGAGDVTPRLIAMNDLFICFSFLL